MTTAITNGIQISVEVHYQPSHSRPSLHEYFFAYRITIENKNNYAVQLINRFWNITDATGAKREVEGEGVVGEQPVLLSGERYQYVSGCPLNTDIGRMDGYYTMKHLGSEMNIQADIPPFLLIAPFKRN